MKLLTTPEFERDYIDTTAFAGTKQPMAGRLRVTDVKIMDHSPDSKTEVWDKLKYGVKPDLLHAMYEREKIEKLAFPESGIMLFGVVPFGFEDDLNDERIFECSIDHFEII